jgi:hypothetical protein
MGGSDCIVQYIPLFKEASTGMIVAEYILNLLAFLGAYFTPEQYLFMTKLQCLLWTAADVVIVYYLIQIANLARGHLNMKKHLAPFIVLGCTLFLIPLVPIAKTGNAIYTLELLITIPHFLLILYILAANTKAFPAFLSYLVNKSTQNS